MKRLAVSTSAWWKATAAIAGIAAITSACGSSGTATGSTTTTSPPSPTAAASSALCEDVAALRTSVANLTDISVSRGAASKLAADAKDVKANLTSLAHAAGTQWSAQIGALTSALSSLQTAITGLGSGGSITSVVSALGKVRTASSDLLATAGTRCPSASASP
ncbi:MAG: hypothetical protein WAK82_40045 [Streptosporangiaceae bacterium]